MRTPHIGLVNIVAGKEVVPEILQYDLSPESLSRKVLEIISDEDKMLGIKEELKKVKAALGRKGASNKAAEAVYDFIKKKCPEV